MGKRMLQLVSLLVLISGWILMRSEETYAVTDYSNEYYTEDKQYIYCYEYDWYIGDGTNKYMLCQYLGSEENIYVDTENTTFFQMMAFYIEKMAMTILA